MRHRSDPVIRFEVGNNPNRSGNLNTRTMTITADNGKVYKNVYRWGGDHMALYPKAEWNKMHFEHNYHPVVDEFQGFEYMRIVASYRGENTCVYFLLDA